MEVLFISKRNEALVNEQIKSVEVRVIGPKGEALGIKKTLDALTLARTAGFDLVMVGKKSNPPVCKLMDYNKFKYEKQKQMKEAKKKQRENNLAMKEYRFSPNIGIGDFNTRVKQATSYLEKGHKIKATIRFRGRQMAYTEQGAEVLNRFAESLKELGDVIEKPSMEGYFMNMIIAPKKEK